MEEALEEKEEEQISRMVVSYLKICHIVIALFSRIYSYRNYESIFAVIDCATTHDVSVLC